jgi:L-noviosyl transferase
MKILATSCPNQGHLFPMLPTLWALRNAGHDVLVAMPDRFAQLAVAAGLPATSISEDFYLGDLGRKKASQGATTNDLIDHVTDYYVPATKLTVQRTVELAETWRPDLIMCTDWEYAAPIAAALLGVPTVLHGWGLSSHPDLKDPIAEALKPIHQDWGIVGGAPEHWRTIDNCPPSLQWTAPADHAIASRYVGYNGSGAMEPWLFQEPEAPRVLVTLGNVPIKGDHAHVLRRTVQALMPFDVEVVIAAGDNLSIDQLGDVPRRTRLIKGLPLSHVVPTCSAVIHHGGAGSVMAATIAGVPQLGLPQMCVQYQHADRIAEVGAGLVLHPEHATVEAITASVHALLEDACLRATVRRLQVENATRPRLDQVVQLLEGAFVSKPTAIPLPRTPSMPYTGHHRASERMKAEPYTTPLLNPSSQMRVSGSAPINVSGPISHLPVNARHSLVTVGAGRDSHQRAIDYPRRDQGTVA